MGDEEDDALQEEELTVLECVYGADFERRGPRAGAVRVRLLATELRCLCVLSFDFGGANSGYPRRSPPPALSVASPDFSLPADAAAVLTRFVRAEAARYAAEDGCAAVSRLCDALSEKLRVADRAIETRVPRANIAGLLESSIASGLDADSGLATSVLQTVPKDSLLCVFAVLDAASLARAAQACRAFRDVAYDPALWHDLLARDFPGADPRGTPRLVYAAEAARLRQARASAAQRKQRKAWSMFAVNMPDSSGKPPSPTSQHQRKRR